MVAEEAMRLYPPAWVVEREALADDVVMGTKIPKGATVGIFPYTLHRAHRRPKCTGLVRRPHRRGAHASGRARMVEASKLKAQDSGTQAIVTSNARCSIRLTA